GLGTAFLLHVLHRRGGLKRGGGGEDLLIDVAGEQHVAAGRAQRVGKQGAGDRGRGGKGVGRVGRQAGAGKRRCRGQREQGADEAKSQALSGRVGAVSGPAGRGVFRRHAGFTRSGSAAEFARVKVA